jgi:hypothetical protein
MPKPTIKLKIIVAIAFIVALVSAVLASISVRQLQTETTTSITKQMHDVGMLPPSLLIAGYAHVPICSSRMRR